MTKQTLNIIFTALIAIWIAILTCCNNKNGNYNSSNHSVKIVYVHDTITNTVMPDGEFVYNLPCKVVNIHQERNLSNFYKNKKSFKKTALFPIRCINIRIITM